MSSSPIYLVLAAVCIVVGLYELYAWAPWLMPLIFGVTVFGLALRWFALARARRRKRDAGAVVGFEALRTKDLARYGPWLKANVRGHDAAVDRVVAKVQQRLTLASPQTTLGAFLLVGPTGTGKTFLGEVMARALYPDSEPLVLRMNEYKDHSDVFTLLGQPPGTAGSEAGGALTRPVLENPYRVVVLDEFDKCHRDVRDCFYDILDAAQCMEKSSGKTVFFSACVFIATSNAGTESLRALGPAAQDFARAAGRIRDAVAREGFEKPLLARFDDILLLDQLKAGDIARVACLQISKYWKQFGIEVTYASPEMLVETLRRNAEFRDYGVRQLSRMIQDLTTPSIEAARKEGATKVRLGFDQGSGKVLMQEAS